MIFRGASRKNSKIVRRNNEFIARTFRNDFSTRYHEGALEQNPFLKSGEGKSTATTVATIQTMRDAAHEVGEISDTVGKSSAESFK